MQDMVVIVNLNASACRLMAQKLRAEHIYCRIVSSICTAEDIQHMGARGILLAADVSGEAESVPHLKDYLQTGLPMLCMGDSALTLCETLGGSLSTSVVSESTMQIHIDTQDVLLSGMDDTDRYQPTIRAMNLDASLAAPIATSDDGLLGFHANQRSVWGFSFRLERNDPFSTHLLLNFVLNVCGCTPWWTNQMLIDRARDEISRAASGGNALCCLSGGIDSGVCAVLGNLAIGHKLHCIFIDTGLLRKNEAEQVMAYYHDSLGLNLQRINEQETFIKALAGVTDSAEKDRIVLDLLTKILSREAAAIDDVRLIIQGTNVADTLLHPHPSDYSINGIPVVEPVRELFKDEIRQIGKELGLPPELVSRQPFPASGLASRIMAEVTNKRLETLRTADDIFRREVDESNQNKRLWQYYAALALSPIYSKGDLIILRAVQTVEGTGGNTARFTSDLLERVTSRILKQCPTVRRVLYDLTPSRSYQRSIQ